LLQGQADKVYGDTDSFAFEVSGAAALYRGDWKITRTLEPYGDSQWHLYDLATDPGETTNVAAQHPTVFQEMLDEYDAYAADVGVFELAPGESARRQLELNAIKGTAANYWYLPAAFLAILVAMLYLVLRVIMLVLKRRPR
jgi:arylsulfatase/uncharacterized sulfatase